MNESGFKNFNMNPVFDQTLLDELLHYGSSLGNFEVEDSSGYTHRIRVFEHDQTRKKYWLRQYNGEIIEFREIT